MHTLFQDQVLYNFAQQKATMDKMLANLDSSQLSMPPKFTARRSKGSGVTVGGRSCTRCITLRSKVCRVSIENVSFAQISQGISPVCLSCRKIAMSTIYKKQPTFSINFVDKKLLLPGEIQPLVSLSLQSFSHHFRNPSRMRLRISRCNGFLLGHRNCHNIDQSSSPTRYPQSRTTRS
jgi:hypothetical protein